MNRVSIEFYYKSSSVLSRCRSIIGYTLLTICSVIASSVTVYSYVTLDHKMTASSFRFRRVCEEDLDKVLNDY